MTDGFNIDRFMNASSKVDLSDIDWAEVPRHPITPEAMRTLRYFLITEGSTFFYTKALMHTNTALRELDFAPFIVAWTYEEEFHGRAFRRFIEAYGEQLSDSSRTQLFVRRGLGERVDEVGQTLLSYVFASSWPAVHMTWGVIQELTTYMAYQALVERVDHPVLQLICRRIMKQELRHYAFYREHARRLLAGVVAQQVVSAALKLAWTPVGDGMCPKQEVCHAVRFLFDGADGIAIPQIEAKVQELPGLSWFNMFTRFAQRHAISKAPSTWMPGITSHGDGALTLS